MAHESLPTKLDAKPGYAQDVEASRLVDAHIVETEKPGNAVEAHIEGDEVQGVKANLRDLYNLMPGVDEDTREFGKMLASRLDSTLTLTPSEFVMICNDLLYDLQAGVNDNTHEPIRNVLVGKKHELTKLRAKIPQIAEKIFPEEFATAVQRALESGEKYN